MVSVNEWYFSNSGSLYTNRESRLIFSCNYCKQVSTQGLIKYLCGSLRRIAAIFFVRFLFILLSFNAILTDFYSIFLLLAVSDFAICQLWLLSLCLH